MDREHCVFPASPSHAHREAQSHTHRDHHKHHAKRSPTEYQTEPSPNALLLGWTEQGQGIHQGTLLQQRRSAHLLSLRSRHSTSVILERLPGASVCASVERHSPKIARGPREHREPLGHSRVDEIQSAGSDLRVWVSSRRTDLVSANLDQSELSHAFPRTSNGKALFLIIKTLYLTVVNLKAQQCRDETTVEIKHASKANKFTKTVFASISVYSSASAAHQT